MKSDILVAFSRAFDNLGVWATYFSVHAAFGAGGSAASTTRRRDDETTSTRPPPTAVATKATKFTKHHKEDLVSLFEWLSPLAGPRFARWQE